MTITTRDNRIDPDLPSAGSVGRVIVISAQPNSTYDLYIAPRLSPEAMAKSVLIDPFREDIDRALPVAEGDFVIINRYVTRRVMDWLVRMRPRLAAVVYVLDDDLSAMVRDPDMPFLNRVRPAITLWHLKRLQGLVSRLLVSTPALGRDFASWGALVVPPVADLGASDPRPLDVNQIYYFAKMHAREHAFLRSVIAALMDRHKAAHFTVTAPKGPIAAAWRSVPRVSVVDEIAYADYAGYLASLSAGGLFLLPLMTTRLNRSRSSAKLIEAARSGSAPLVSDHDAYAAYRAATGAPGLPPVMDDWIARIEERMRDPVLAMNERDKLRAYLADDYARRGLIV
ncbi:MAG: hypothetical protein H2045_11205 [Rhizobiales bacterium]|nr:hypothetical protein [Hyphomicrobiales bacterium]